MPNKSLLKFAVLVLVVVGAVNYLGKKNVPVARQVRATVLG